MKKSWVVLASVVFLGAGPVPQQPPMTFFITSAGSGKGADLGGLEGADRNCQALADAAGEELPPLGEWLAQWLRGGLIVRCEAPA